MTITEAKAALNAARTELSKLSNAESVERAALCEKWYGPLSAAKQAVDEAKRALDLATAEAAKVEHLAKIGARYVEWRNETERHNTWDSVRKIPWERTGRIGIVDVFNPDTKVRNKWSRPNPGDLYIRPLLKSGTPGADAIKFGSYDSEKWFPEGVHPDEAPKPETRRIDL